MIRLALVEDDLSVRDAVTLGMVHRGYAVHAYDSGEAALAAIRTANTDVCLVDLMLPGIGGIQVCRELRLREAGLPLVILTARDSDADVIEGLDAGADDYIIKPAEPRVIDARLRAVLRRATAEPESAAVSTVRDLHVDTAAVTVRRGGIEITLTPTEMRLLLCLYANRGTVLSRSQLLDSVWGYTYSGDERLVDTTVQRLRSKIEADRHRPQIIRTVRGFGYRLDT